MRFSSTILFCVLVNFCIAQKDTIVKGKHYNHWNYYSNGQLQSLGNYKDTLKTGRWTYYKKNGELLASGRYGGKEGGKIGKWHYVSAVGKRKINWRFREPGETIELNEEGDLVIFDYIYKSPCIWTYKNGKVFTIARI